MSVTRALLMDISRGKSVTVDDRLLSLLVINLRLISIGSCGCCEWGFKRIALLLRRERQGEVPDLWLKAH